MPKISETTREARRRHVMVSAWKCFSRKGFQATTMDEMIGSAAEESLTTTRGVLVALLDQRPVAGPRSTLAALVGALQRQIDQPGYDLTKISVNAWGEALRNPE